MADNGIEKFILEIDTSHAEKQKEEVIDMFDDVGDAAENAGKKIDKSLATSNEVIEKVINQSKDVVKSFEETAESAEGLGDKMDKAMSGTNTQSLRMQLRAATEELATLTIQYRSMSEQERASAAGKELEKKINELVQKAGTLRDAMDDANTSIKNVASDTARWDALGQGLNVLTSSVGAATGAMEMFGMSQEDVQAVQAKLQASLAISNALSVAQAALQKESALMLGIRAVKEGAAAIAIDIRAAAEGRGIIVTKAATIAQAAFNAVAKANPYVLLAAAIASVVGAFVLFSKGAKQATENEKKLNEEHERQTKYLEELGSSAASMEASYHKLQNQWKQLKTTSEKNQFIKENAKAFENLGLKVRDTADAEKVLIKNTEKVIQSFRLRAEAMAAEKGAIAAYEQYYKKLAEADFKQDNVKAGDSIGYGEKAEAKLTAKDIKKTPTGSLEDGSYREVETLTESGARKVNALRKRKAEEQRKEFEEQQRKELNATLKVYDEAQARANKELAKYDFVNGTNDTKTETKTNNNKTTTSASTAAADAYAKAGKELADKYAEAEVNSFEDGEKKTLAQLKLNHDRTLAEIKREEEELLKLKQAAAKETGGAAVAELDPAEKAQFAQRTKWAIEAYNNSVDEIKHAQSRQMQEFYAQYGSYTQQIEAITALYTDQISKATTKGEKNGLAAQMMENIANIQSTYRQNLESASTKSLQGMLKSLNAVKEANKGAFTQEQLDALNMQISDLTTEIETRNPFTEMKKAAEELKLAQDEVAKAQSNLANAKSDVLKATNAQDLAKAKEREAKASAALSKAEEREARATSRVNSANNKAITSINKLVSACEDVGDAIGGTAGEIIGMATNIASVVTNSISGMNAAAEAGSQAMQQVERASVILAIISAAIQIAQKIANILTAAHDARYEKQIEEYQKQIDILENKYDALGKAVEKTYSKIKQSNINEQIKNQQMQIQLLSQSIDAERKKKKTDDDAIKEYQDKIKELQDNIADLKEQAKDAIFGEDINTAIENFADAYAEAWTNGESKVKSARQVVKEMMQSMVTESIKSAIQAAGAMEKIRAKLNEFYADGILTAWEQDYIYGLAEDLENEIEDKFGWAKDIYRSSDQQSDTAGGFATMSQDSADELNGRFTAVQMATNNIDTHVSQLVEINAEVSENVVACRLQTEEIANLTRQAVDHLGSIEKNTRELYEMNSRLEQIERNTRSL